MPYKIAGVDENGNFTPRVETALLTKIKNEVSVDGKATKEALDLIYAPISGSDKYASLDTNGKVPASQLPPAAPTTPTLRTAYVNLPPIWEKITTVASGTQCRGVYFACTTSGTIKKIRAKIDAGSGNTYTLGVYELNTSNRLSVAAVVGTATYTAPATATGSTVSVDVNLPIVAGKYYLIAIYCSTGVSIYYTNSGGYFSSAVSTTIWEGGTEPQRSAAVNPIVGTVLTGGSDYVCVGISVDY